MSFQLEFLFLEDDERIKEYDSCVSLLLTTREGSMPLEREFGINMDFLDMPPATARSLYTAEVTKKLRQFIPELRVQSITWQQDTQGKSIPKVAIGSA